jgi:hypothetical protein
MASANTNFWFNIDALKNQLLASKKIEQLRDLSAEETTNKVVKVKEYSR